MKSIRNNRSFQYAEINEEDVSPTERPIATVQKKAFKYVGVAGGGLIVLALFLFLSMRAATVLLMPSITVVQTSLLHLEDRLSVLDTEGMKERGFDTGLLAFGNTECNKLMKAIKLETFGYCKPPPLEETSTVSVDSDVKYQEILGFGGAFTEAASINFYKLPKAIQQRVVSLYWGQQGIGYTLGRVPINSCDFSPSSYSFDAIEGDEHLAYFDTELTHDNAYMMPLMRLALEEAQAWGSDLKLVASPWSPPAWMKEPVDGVQSMNGSASPMGLIDTHEMKMTWAKYISKWVEAYQAKGIPIWAITPQNEPEFAAPWEACKWDAVTERDWIAQYLGPVIKHYHPDLKILAFDHNKDHLFDWATAILGDEVSAKYVDGMAFHWYAGGFDRMLDGTFGYNNVNKTHHAFPEKLLINTEGCSCPGVLLDDWLRAERHGHDVIFDLLNYANGWIDWNLLVNHEGGINHVGNNCDAPLVCNEDFTDVHYQPKFFYMAHFSRFIRPGSVRVSSHIVGNFGFNPELQTGARAGVEVQMWPCEKSTRQQWRLDAKSASGDSLIALQQELTWAQNDEEGKKMEMSARLCLGGADGWMPDRPYLSLVDCNTSAVGADEHPPLRVALQADGYLVETSTGKCVGLAEDSMEAGALLGLLDCVTPHRPSEEAHRRTASEKRSEATHLLGSQPTTRASHHQLFRHDAHTGEIRLHPESDFKGNMCLTAGWPFLTGAAFQDKDQSKVIVVVMNEATQDTKITLQDNKKGTGWFGISGRSIQTILY